MKLSQELQTSEDVYSIAPKMEKLLKRMQDEGYEANDMIKMSIDIVQSMVQDCQQPEPVSQLSSFPTQEADPKRDVEKRSDVDVRFSEGQTRGLNGAEEKELFAGLRWDPPSDTV